jgi:hypothetical protein
MPTIERVLTVFVTLEDGQYHAYSDAPALGGYGDTPDVALRAYADALGEMIEESGGPEAEQ